MQITIKATPKQKVNLVTNNSPPRSFRTLNKSLLPPLMILASPPDLPPCNSTMAINNIDITINKISKLITSFDYTIIYHN